MTQQHEFFREWCNPSPTTFRIHMSHTDLDGYGCQIVSSVLDTIYDLYNERQYPICNCNCNYDIEEQMSVFWAALDEAYPFKEPIEGRLFLVLVSDLSRFDPEAIFGPYIRKGYNIKWYVLDHHQCRDTERIAKLDATPGCGYYVDTKQSATLHCYDHLTKYGWLMLNNKRGLIRCEDIVNRLHTFATAVSASDTGNFGTWANCAEVVEISSALYERLLFGQYERLGAESEWFRFTYMRMVSINIIAAGKMPLYVIHHGCSDIVKRELHKLQEEYNDMLSMIDQFDGTDINDDKLIGFDGLNVEILYDYEGTNFSMLAKEYLIANPDVDILMMYNSKRREYSMRSADGGCDCSKIAEMNGGGGHPRAAGFPLKPIKKN